MKEYVLTEPQSGDSFEVSHVQLLAIKSITEREIERMMDREGENEEDDMELLALQDFVDAADRFLDGDPI